MKVSQTKSTDSVTFSTKAAKNEKQRYAWWKAKSDQELNAMVLSTAAYLKEGQTWRNKQASTFARLYGNQSLFSFIGSSMSKVNSDHGLPPDRPTFNLVQSAVDTLVSRISQSRPSPTFLTDNGDYKERNLAKKLNNFVAGELYSTKAYELGEFILRDALVEGTGCIKVYEGPDHKVALDRVLLTELLIDESEAMHGNPRQLFQLKLIDRSVLKDMFPALKAKIEEAATAYPDNSADSSKSISDLVMVVEAWHLKSGPEAKDGRHTIACSAGNLLNEVWTKDKFPFVFLHYSKRLLGFWSQGLAEQLMGTQLEINSLLYTISKAIKLVGVPRIFQEQGSKVSKAHHNNEIGTIITYSGVKPSYEVAACVPQELYAQLQRLIDYGYQQCGVSSLQATSQKPAGLNSGEAIRSYDDISTDRFAALSRRYDNLFIDLAYAITDLAKDIAEEQGSYSTVYPNKNGVKEIDLPKASLLDDDYVIQAFNMSALPRDPAGRMQKVTEMVASNMITLKEGRRLLDFPDLNQIETLANAGEERVFQILDSIIEDGVLTSPPDAFMDLQLASELTTQYINLYGPAKLEEERCQMLRDFFVQIQALLQQAQAAMAPPPGPPGGPGMAPAPGVGVPAPAVAPPPPVSGVQSQA